MAEKGGNSFGGKNTNYKCLKESAQGETGLAVK
jgi:hypothetical protein